MVSATPLSDNRLVVKHDLIDVWIPVSIGDVVVYCGLDGIVALHMLLDLQYFRAD